MKSLVSYLTTAFSLALLVGCVSEPIQREELISFTASTGLTVTSVPSTKVFVESDDATLRSSGFLVSACQGDRSLFVSTEVRHNGSLFIPTIPAYWAEGMTSLSFYGVSPTTETITIVEDGVTVDYADNSETDLLVAVAEDARRGVVHLPFSHVLSQIRSVSLSFTRANLDCTLTSLEVIAPASGTYSTASSFWSRGTNHTVPLFNGSQAVGSTPVSLGGPLTLIPGRTLIRAVWTLEQDGRVLETLDYSFPANLAIGTAYDVRILLDTTSETVSLSTSVASWTCEDNYIDMEGGSVSSYRLTVTSNDESMGTVTGGGNYLDGESATLKATPKDGYRFVRWSDDVTDATRTVTVTQNASYTAFFRQAGTFSASVTIVPEGAGTVSLPGQVTEGKPGYSIATANKGYAFSHWQDGYTMKRRYDIYNSDVALTAYFIEQSDNNYIDATYNITSTTVATKILGSSTPISSMSVDGQESIDATAAYLFSTTGEHTVRFFLKDDTESFVSLFAECTSLVRVNTTHADFSKITNFADVFDRCSSLQEVIGIENWDMSMAGYTNTAPGYITITPGADPYGTSMFQLCSSLQTMIVPPTCKKIAGFMFNHCSSATNEEVFIPASVESITAVHCFYNCGKDGVFKRFVVDPANTAFKSVDGVLMSMDGTRLYAIPRALEVSDRTYSIPEGVTHLGELSFSREQTFDTVVLPDSYTIKEYCNGDMGGGINHGNSLSVAIYCYTTVSAYAVKGSNPNYLSDDGCIYSKDGKSLIAVPTRKSGVLTVREGCQTINKEAVWYDMIDGDGVQMFHLTGVSIPASVTAIDADQLAGFNRMVDSHSWTLTVHQDNPKYTIQNGKIVSKQ